MSLDILQDDELNIPQEYYLDFAAFDYLYILNQIRDWFVTSFKITRNLTTLPPLRFINAIAPMYSNGLIKPMDEFKRIIDDNKMFIALIVYDLIERDLLHENFLLESNFDLSKSQFINSFSSLSNENIYETLCNSSAIIHKILGLTYEPELLLTETMEYIEDLIWGLNRIEVVLFRAEGNTLEKCGKKFNVTRERIRQIVRKTFKKYDFLFQMYVGVAFENEYFIKESDFHTLNRDDSIQKIIKCYLMERKKFVFLDDLSVYMSRDSTEYKDYNCFIKKLLTSNRIDFTMIEELQREFPSLEQLFNSIEIQEVLLSNNYYYFNEEFVFLTRYKDFVLEIIKKYFEDGIELRQNSATDDYDLMISLCKKYFPKVQIPNVPRSVIARISESLVAIDRSKHLHKDTFENKSYDISFVEKFITEINNKEVYYSELYKKYKKNFKLIGIHNWFHLRSVMKYVYSDSLVFTRDTFSSSRESNKETISDRIYNFTSTIDGIFSIEILREQFPGISDISIYYLLSDNMKYIKWGNLLLNNDYITRRLLNKISLLTNLDSFIVEELNHFDFISIPKTFKLLEKKVDLSNYFIFNEFHLRNYFVHLSDKCTVLEEGLMLKTSNLSKLSLINRIKHYLSLENKFNYNEVKDFFDKKNVRMSVFNQFVMYIKDECLRVNENEYLELSVSKNYQEQMGKIDDSISRYSQLNSLVSLKEFVDEAGYTLDSEYEWNEFLVASMINKFKSKYNFVRFNTNDRNIVRGILTTQEELSLSDIIFEYFVSLNIEQIDEYELTNFLNTKMIILGDLPLEFLENKKISYKDGMFYLRRISAQ